MLLYGDIPLHGQPCYPLGMLLLSGLRGGHQIGETLVGLGDLATVCRLLGLFSCRSCRTSASCAARCSRPSEIKRRSASPRSACCRWSRRISSSRLASRFSVSASRFWLSTS